jgi:hypothetical protein
MGLQFFCMEKRVSTYMAYIIGNRNQKTLFPPTVEDYVGTEDTVRRRRKGRPS